MPSSRNALAFLLILVCVIQEQQSRAKGTRLMKGVDFPREGRRYNEPKLEYTEHYAEQLSADQAGEIVIFSKQACLPDDFGVCDSGTAVSR